MADTASTTRANEAPGETAQPPTETEEQTRASEESPYADMESALVGGRDVPPSAAELVGQLKTSVLATAITRRMSRMTADEALFLTMILEFDRRNGWAAQGVLSCAHWLAWKCGLSLPTAKERLRVARTLENLPKLRAAFARGEVSYSKVRALTRIGTPELDDRLLALALSGNASHVERVVRGFRRGNRPRSARRTSPPDGPSDESTDARRSGRENDGSEGDELPEGLRDVNAVRLPDGRMRLTAVLEADEIEILFLALRKARESAEAASSAQADVPVVDEAASGDDVNPESRVSEVADLDAERSARRASSEPIRDACGAVSGPYADALLRLAESFLAHGPAARPGDERNTLVVHVESDVLSGAEEPDLIDRCGLEPGPTLGLPTIRRIACDCTVIDAVTGESEVDAESHVTVPRWLRRRLRRRDGGCRYPGCSDHQWVDAHFIVHWTDGGALELDNLVLLCLRHHRYVHEFGCQVRVLGSGAVEVTDPSGAVVPVSPPLPGVEEGQGSQAPAAACDGSSSNGPSDDAVVAAPSCYWTGEALDLDEAVAALLDDTKRRWSFPWFRKSAKHSRRNAG
ncbi:HNH endonuclease signature motif containing protein [Fodinicola acaciae]|uniref:HNH endonuclease signature motif containing protein n=1 Tax=Fodinicola acaciae TaxID=2681555 RepID=UPI0013D7F0EC|nr:HNH endonuclease signature motif containing protein [Fodinicola acaciae]